jgi:hypothetical protein
MLPCSFSIYAAEFLGPTGFDGSRAGGPFSQTSTGVVVLSVIIPIAFISLLAAAAFSVLLLRSKAEDPTARLLRQKVTELREQLEIQTRDDYVLSGERVAPWLRGGCVVIRRGYMEAAARLAMWAEFRCAAA